MTAPELGQAVWRKSSRSNGQGQCVEVADLGQTVAMRDSKHPAAAVLVFPAAAWAAFIDTVKAGDFDR